MAMRQIGKVNYGALHENAVAQELACRGFDLAYN